MRDTLNRALLVMIAVPEVPDDVLRVLSVIVEDIL